MRQGGSVKRSLAMVFCSSWKAIPKPWALRLPPGKTIKAPALPGNAPLPQETAMHIMNNVA